MAFCPNCGRPLGENEVCGCTSQYASPYQSVPDPAAYNYQNGQGQQVYDQQNYNYNQNMGAPKKKSHAGVIVVIVIIVLLVLCLPITGVLAAILVPSMLGYTAKSQQASANSAAKTLYNSYITSLTEMDSEGKNVSGTYVICSEPDANINVPGDADLFYTLSEKYFSDIDNYTYFVVVVNGGISYVACVENDGDTIGTYPNASIVNEGPESYSGAYTDTDWDINDLYLDACEDLFSYY